MSSNHLERTPVVNRAVEIYNVVITNTLKAALAVPSIDVVDGHVSAFGCGRTVNNDFVDSSHSVLLSSVWAAMSVVFNYLQVSDERSVELYGAHVVGRLCGVDGSKSRG